jgi:hypothetical protein
MGRTALLDRGAMLLLLLVLAATMTGLLVLYERQRRLNTSLATLMAADSFEELPPSHRAGRSWARVRVRRAGAVRATPHSCSSPAGVRLGR